MPDPLDLPKGITQILSRPAATSYDGTIWTDLGHKAALELRSGTVALSFASGWRSGDQAILSKDLGGNNAGDLTVWLRDGTLVVTMEDGRGNTEWLKVPGVILDAERTYHLALGWGKAGLQVWLDGALAAAEPEWKIGLGDNANGLVIGGTRAWRGDGAETAHSLFYGRIGDVRVFDAQLGAGQVAALAGATDAHLGEHAQNAQDIAALMPVLTQLHHASDTLLGLAAQHGADTGHAPGMAMGGMGGMGGMAPGGHVLPHMPVTVGTDANESFRGTAAGDAIDGRGGNDRIRGEGGDNTLQGGHGNDRLWGRNGADVLDGGAGEDVLDGGGGADWLISRADAREPRIARVPGRDEADPMGELTDGKLYPDQPVPGDDVLTGGAGADVFYFQTLINAKAYLIEKHTDDDGTVNWHGVAGENANLHDHWVDTLGDDVITDYSRADGDRIVIEGHTTKIRAIRYEDANGDGVMDRSVIALYSDQGSGGGAHHMDALGTVTVYGDLVKLSDIETTAAPAYGIVTDITDLAEAVAPAEVAPDTERMKVTKSLLGTAETPAIGKAAPVLALPGSATLTGAAGDYLDVGHHTELALRSGTVALSFASGWRSGDQAILSKDLGGNNAGDLTVWLRDGTLVVTMEDGRGNTEWLKVPGVILDAERTYHLALGWGKAGLQVWLDGALAAAEPQWKVGLGDNANGLVIGGTRAWRGDGAETAHSLFYGRIGDVRVFDAQLGAGQVAALAGATDAHLGEHAQNAQDIAALMPVLTQLHHASDTLLGLAAQHGADTGHGPGMEMGGMAPGGHVLPHMPVTVGTDANESFKGTEAADAIDGRGGNDWIRGEGGDNTLQGGHGNDRLWGRNGADVLDGGAGEDLLLGGGGDDWLISRADAREPAIARVPGRDEKDPMGELTEGKLYPDQPVPGDDVLTGGAGADVFYFQTLINAKAYLIEKHTDDDGTVNWHGVAGENVNLHDHWVDTLGDDAITDYSRADGDRIVIEGHTTKIRAIRYDDANGDGVMDRSVIALYSDQGSGGGAHHMDALGTVTVYGDLVKLSDIETTAAPAYGIVTDITDLAQAIAPAEVATDTRPYTAPGRTLPRAGDLVLSDGTAPVIAVVDAHRFVADSRDALVIDSTKGMRLDEGSIALTFTREDATWAALFSKDATDYGKGGHLTAYVEEDGDLVVRFQSTDQTRWLIAPGAIGIGQSHDLAVTWGAAGATVWLDGIRVAYDATLRHTLAANAEAFVIGGTGWNNLPGATANIGGALNGTIAHFALYAGQKTAADLGQTPPVGATLALDGAAAAFDIGIDADGTLGLTRRGSTVETTATTRFLAFDDLTVRIEDVRIGKSGADTLEGTAGSDLIHGQGGADRLSGGLNDDLIAGEAGNDSVWGGGGDDRLFGGDDDDYLDGDDGADTIEGGSGNDTLDGDAGDDQLSGGEGSDELKGGAGSDTMRGGFGDDTFYGHIWGEAPPSADRRDAVVFDGNFADYDYSQESWWNGSRGKSMDVLIVTDHPGGGLDGYYEGRDRLIDIDRLIFADRVVEVSDLF